MSAYMCVSACMILCGLEKIQIRNSNEKKKKLKPPKLTRYSCLFMAFMSLCKHLTTTGRLQ